MKTPELLKHTPSNMKIRLLISYSLFAVMLNSCGNRNMPQKTIDIKDKDSVIVLNTRSCTYKININQSGFISSLEQHKNVTDDGVNIDFHKDGSFKSVSHFKDNKVNGDFVVFYPSPYNKMIEWHDPRYRDKQRYDNQWKFYYNDGSIKYDRSHYIELDVRSHLSGVYVKIMTYNPYFSSSKLMVLTGLDSTYKIKNNIVDTIKNIKVGDSLLVAKKVRTGENHVYLEFISTFMENGSEKSNSIYKHVTFIVPNDKEK